MGFVYQEWPDHHRFYECKKQLKQIENDGGKILALHKTKSHELVLIYRTSYLIDSDPDIYAFVYPVDKKMPPRQLALFVFYEVEKKEFFIADIQIRLKDYNKGYGSLLMAQLLKLAKKENIALITGNISGIDWNHVDRIRHFYRKHEFSVELDYKKRAGKIRWVGQAVADGNPSDKANLLGCSFTQIKDHGQSC